MQGVQGSDFEQTGPSPFKQSRLEPITLPPFADAKQDCKMRRGWEGNGAHTLALKMYAYCKTTNRTAKSDVSANFIRAHDPRAAKRAFKFLALPLACKRGQTFGYGITHLFPS